MQRNYDQELNIAHIQLKRAWINMWSGILSLTAVESKALVEMLEIGFMPDYTERKRIAEILRAGLEAQARIEALEEAFDEIREKYRAMVKSPAPLGNKDERRGYMMALWSVLDNNKALLGGEGG